MNDKETSNDKEQNPQSPVPKSSLTFLCPLLLQDLLTPRPEGMPTQQGTALEWSLLTLGPAAVPSLPVWSVGWMCFQWNETWHLNQELCVFDL